MVSGFGGELWLRFAMADSHGTQCSAYEQIPEHNEQDLSTQTLSCKGTYVAANMEGHHKH